MRPRICSYKRSTVTVTRVAPSKLTAPFALYVRFPPRAEIGGRQTNDCLGEAPTAVSAAEFGWMMPYHHHLDHPEFPQQAISSGADLNF
jgi:hypothetical protein